MRSIHWHSDDDESIAARGDSEGGHIRVGDGLLHLE